MRAFVRRMDDAGGLDELCDALDRAYYADMSDGLTPSRCRALRRRMRRAVRRGADTRPDGAEDREHSSNAAI